jgi:hypothetical protein
VPAEVLSLISLSLSVLLELHPVLLLVNSLLNISRAGNSNTGAFLAFLERDFDSLI